MIITIPLVIFMIIVFVLLFLFFNTVDKRKWLTLIISAVITPFAYFHLFYPFINIISNYHHQKYFNSEAWTEQPALRYEMADFMIESDTLIGIDKSKAELLLGKAEWLSWDYDNNEFDNDKWNFTLGIEPGAFNDKVECFEIEFENNKLKRINPFQQELTYDKKEENTDEKQ